MKIRMLRVEQKFAIALPAKVHFRLLGSVMEQSEKTAAHSAVRRVRITSSRKKNIKVSWHYSSPRVIKMQPAFTTVNHR